MIYQSFLKQYEAANHSYVEKSGLDHHENAEGAMHRIFSIPAIRSQHGDPDSGVIV